MDEIGPCLAAALDTTLLRGECNPCKNHRYDRHKDDFGHKQPPWVEIFCIFERKEKGQTPAHRPGFCTFSPAGRLLPLKMEPAAFVISNYLKLMFYFFSATLT
jgi:hypothetical protein